MAEKELQHLIDGCLKQDRQSQKLLYQNLYGFAMKICLRYANNQHDASEVLNDGFFKAFTRIDQYNNSWPFKAWLSKIMYHAAVDYYRAGWRWARIEELDTAGPVMSESTVEHKLGYEDLLAMVRRLPPAYRMVFNLYAIDGYSHDEIGRMMGISASTSRANLHKARMKLQQMIARPQSLIVLLIWEYKLRVSPLPAANKIIQSKPRH